MRGGCGKLRGGSWGRRRWGGGGGDFVVAVGFGEEGRKDYCFAGGVGGRAVAIGRGGFGCRRDRR